MGNYVLKIGSTPRLIEGVPVYEATYAYKPFYREEYDAPIRARLKLDALEKRWSKKPEAERRNILVSYHGEVYHLYGCYGTIGDEALTECPKWATVVKVGGRLRLKWEQRRVWLVRFAGLRNWVIAADRDTGAVTIKDPDGSEARPMHELTSPLPPTEAALARFVTAHGPAIQRFMRGINTL